MSIDEQFNTQRVKAIGAAVDIALIPGACLSQSDASEQSDHAAATLKKDLTISSYIKCIVSMGLRNPTPMIIICIGSLNHESSSI
jgi:hypothetical protein